MLENKKLLKEIKTLLVSSEKAKKLAVAELDRIDAKYKALAEKEKSSLNETIKMLDSQLKLYGQIIVEDTDIPETELVETIQTDDTPVTEPEPKAAEDEVVKDTIFDDNNDETDEPEETEDVSDDTESSDEPKEDVPVMSDDDGWPDIPEEW